MPARRQIAHVRSSARSCCSKGDSPAAVPPNAASGGGGPKQTRSCAAMALPICACVGVGRRRFCSKPVCACVPLCVCSDVRFCANFLRTPWRVTVAAPARRLTAPALLPACPLAFQLPALRVSSTIWLVRSEAIAKVAKNCLPL